MYNFTKSKVRKNGVVLNKYDLCQEIHRVSLKKGYSYYSYISYSIYPELYSYEECKFELQSLL